MIIIMPITYSENSRVRFSWILYPNPDRTPINSAAITLNQATPIPVLIPVRIWGRAEGKTTFLTTS